MKRIIFALLLVAPLLFAQQQEQVTRAPLWYPKTATNLVTLGNYNVGINSLYNYMIGDTAIFRMRSGQVQFLSNGVWTAIPDTSIDAGGWSDNGSNITPTTNTDTVKIKYMQFVTGGNWGSPTFTNIGATTIALTGLGTSDVGWSLKNLAAIPTGITTDYSRIIGVDDGSNVKPYYVSDDATVETNQLLLTDKMWAGIPAAYQFDGVDDYVSIADNANLNFGTGDYSIEMYVLVNTLTSGDNICIGKRNGDNRFGFGFKASGSKIGLFHLVYNVAKGITFSETSGYVIDYNQRSHCVVTVDRDGNTVMYLNGIPIYTNTTGFGADVDINVIGNLTLLQNVSANTAFLNGYIHFARLYNRALTQSEVTQHYNNGRPDLYQLDYADRGASQTTVATYDSSAVNDSTITLMYGKKYRWTKGNADSLKIGSTAYTDTTEFTWTTGSVYAYGDLTNSNMLPVGVVGFWTPQNAGRLGWIDASGNQLSGQTSGSPICLNTESRPIIYKDIKLLIAANTNTTLTNVIPRGYKITDIECTGSDSLTAVKIGTSSGGEEIVASTTTVSTNSKLLTLAATANDAYSSTADRTIYARHDTGASGKTMKLIFYLTKVGN